MLNDKLFNSQKKMGEFVHKTPVYFSMLAAIVVGSNDDLMLLLSINTYCLINFFYITKLSFLLFQPKMSSVGRIVVVQNSILSHFSDLKNIRKMLPNNKDSISKKKTSKKRCKS